MAVGARFQAFSMLLLPFTATGARFDSKPGEVYVGIGSTTSAEANKQAIDYQQRWELYNHLFDVFDESVDASIGLRFGTTAFDWWADEVGMDMNGLVRDERHDELDNQDIWPGMDSVATSFPGAAADRCDKYECLTECMLYQDRNHHCRDACDWEKNATFDHHTKSWQKHHHGPEPVTCEECVTLTKDCVEKHCGLECEPITYAADRWSGNSFPTCLQPVEAKLWNNRRGLHNTKPMTCVGDKVFNTATLTWGTVKYVSIMRNLYKVRERSRCWRCGPGVLRFAQAEELVHHTSLLRDFPKMAEEDLYPSESAEAERPQTPFEGRLQQEHRVWIEARGWKFNAFSN